MRRCSPAVAASTQWCFSFDHPAVRTQAFLKYIESVELLGQEQSHQIEQIFVAKMNWGRCEKHHRFACIAQSANHAVLFCVTVPTVMGLVNDKKVDWSSALLNAFDYLIRS